MPKPKKNLFAEQLVAMDIVIALAVTTLTSLGPPMLKTSLGEFWSNGVPALFIAALLCGYAWTRIHYK